MSTLSRHCELCDHQEFNFKTGTTCALTKRKPEFNRTCSKIELSAKFENHLKTINITYLHLKKKKAMTVAYFITMLLIGVSIITGGILLGKYALGNRVISAVPILIIGLSLGPLVMAFGKLNSYLQEFRVSKSKKERLDEVIELYSIQYDLDIKFGKEYHDNQEVYVDLNIKIHKSNDYFKKIKAKKMSLIAI